MLACTAKVQLISGQVLAGKYRVERVLGQGGMGMVVAAHHLDLDEAVAIKFLLPEALRHADAVARFEREARALAKIRSEHVARVADVGRLESGEPYMVMELLRGMDLAELLEKRGALSVAEVADYLLQAGEAIAEAHSLGIVHRDLKPHNLYLTHRADGSTCVKVLDFGISKMTQSGAQQALTVTSVVLGSPLYMAPEQLASAPDIDSRADIWAMGVICFQLLTGVTPFSAPTLPQLFMAISGRPPELLRSKRPDLPQEIEALITRCLEKERELRPASIAEVAAVLVRFAPASAAVSAERIARLSRSLSSGATPPVTSATLSDSHFSLAPPVPVTSSEGAAQATVADATIDGLARTKSAKPGRRRGGYAVLAALAALGLGGWLLRSRPREGPAEVHGAASPSNLAAARPSTVPVVPMGSAEATPAPGPAVLGTTSAPAGTTPPPVVASSEVPPRRAAPMVPTAAAVTRGFSKERSGTSAAPAPSVDCDVPYFFDAKGNKIFKKACL